MGGRNEKEKWIKGGMGEYLNALDSRKSEGSEISQKIRLVIVQKYNDN